MIVDPQKKQLVRHLKNLGLSFSEIGKSLGFSRQRAFNIYYKHHPRGHIVLEPQWTDGLNSRTVALIHKLQLKSVDDVYRAIESGKITKSRGFGHQSYSKLCLWVVKKQKSIQ